MHLAEVRNAADGAARIALGFLALGRNIQVSPHTKEGAYRGAIRADRGTDPCVPAGELGKEIDVRVVFWVPEDEGGRRAGIMGIQHKAEVASMRHAYVATAGQREASP